MGKSKLIDCIVYPADIYISYDETDDEFKRNAKRNGLPFTQRELDTWDMGDAYGKCCYYQEYDNKVVIRLKQMKPELLRGTIVHESLHAAFFILDDIGVRLSYDTQEAFTYLQGFIIKKCHEVINAKNKSKRKG